MLIAATCIALIMTAVANSVIVISYKRHYRQMPDAHYPPNRGVKIPG